MDNTDKRILQIIQYDFPLVSRPYQVIGEKLSLPEDEVIQKIKNLKEEKIIRRVGGVFASKKLGYTSLLCSIKTTSEDRDKVALILNEYPGITHNYHRDHEYNVWFTLITENKEIKDRIINEIIERTGYMVNQLPAIKIYKLRAVFQIPEGDE